MPIWWQVAKHAMKKRPMDHLSDFEKSLEVQRERKVPDASKSSVMTSKCPTKDAPLTLQVKVMILGYK